MSLSLGNSFAIYRRIHPWIFVFILRILVHVQIFISFSLLNLLNVLKGRIWLFLCLFLCVQSQTDTNEQTKIQQPDGQNRQTNTMVSQLGLGRISGRISDIKITRTDFQYCRIFSLTFLKLSDRISDNLVFYIKQHWYYPAGYSAKSDIRPNLNLNSQMDKQTDGLTETERQPENISLITKFIFKTHFLCVCLCECVFVSPPHSIWNLYVVFDA